MTFTCLIEEDGRTRRFGEADFPLTLGGAGADIVVPGLAGEDPAAFLALDEGELYAQPRGRERLSLGGRPIAASQWLRDGDELRLRGTRIRVVWRRDRRYLQVRHLPLERPEAAAPPGPRPDFQPEAEVIVRPVDFRPRPFPIAARKRAAFRRPPWRVLATAVPVLAAAAALFAARFVEVQVDPAPERLSVSGFPHLGWGATRLLLPGDYTVTAEREGYRPLEQPLAVTGDRRQVARFVMERLPGLVLVQTSPAAAVRDPRGRRGSGDDAAASAGDPRRRSRGVAARGGIQDGQHAPERDRRRRAADAPGHARPGPRPRLVLLRARGRDRARGRGRGGAHAAHRGLELGLARGRGHPLGPPPRGPDDRGGGRAAAHRAVPSVWSRCPAVSAWPASPAGAAVRVDGEFRGETPLDIEVSPLREHALRLTKAGHEAAEASGHAGPGRGKVGVPRPPSPAGRRPGHRGARRRGGGGRRRGPRPARPDPQAHRGGPRDRGAALRVRDAPGDGHAPAGLPAGR